MSHWLTDGVYQVRGICGAMQDFSEGLTEDEGLAAMDAPGPRLLDGYDTDPGGADTERRARRRALLRRNIGRRSSALLIPWNCFHMFLCLMESAGHCAPGVATLARGAGHF